MIRSLRSPIEINSSSVTCIQYKGNETKNNFKSKLNVSGNKTQVRSIFINKFPALVLIYHNIIK